MKRAQIWWATLSDPVASEPGYKRPIIIVQSNDFNKSRINTVIAVVVTSNLSLALAPGNGSLSLKKTGLNRESVANVSQIITIDKQFLQEQVGVIDKNTMQQIDEGIRLVLSL